MDKQQVLREIQELLALHESSIGQHPPATVGVYEKARDLFVQGQMTAAKEGVEIPPGFTAEEFFLIERYALASAFISAWYHMHGDSRKRDDLSQATAAVVAGTGLDGEAAFRRILNLEQTWRRTLAAEGIGSSSPGVGVWIAAITVVVLILALVF